MVIRVQSIVNKIRCTHLFHFSTFCVVLTKYKNTNINSELKLLWSLLSIKSTPTICKSKILECLIKRTIYSILKYAVKYYRTLRHSIALWVKTLVITEAQKGGSENIRCIVVNVGRTREALVRNPSVTNLMQGFTQIWLIFP